MEPNSELPPVETSKLPKEAGTGNENLSPAAETFGNQGSYAAPPAASTPIQDSSSLPTLGQLPAPNPAANPVLDTGLIADEADLIEKEWVDKAKAIVANTKDDPHLQNKEMSKVKAQYLKTRYNKDLKLSEE
jgi:hypothetical protein